MVQQCNLVSAQFFARRNEVSETPFVRDRLGYTFIPTPTTSLSSLDQRHAVVDYFSTQTQRDLLKERVPEKRLNDPFFQHSLVSFNEKYQSNNLSLSFGLKFKAKSADDHVSNTLEAQTENLALMTSPQSAAKDSKKIIDALREMSAHLDGLFKSHFGNKNNLSAASRERDFDLYQTAQRHLRDIYAAYLREQAQGNEVLPDEDFIAAFTDEDSCYELEMPQASISEILDESALEGLETLTPSDNLNQQVAVQSFEEAVKALETFLQSEKMKLAPSPEDYIYNFFNNLGIFDLFGKYGLALASGTGSAVAGTLHVALKCWKALQQYDLDAENAFRKALKNNLQSVSKLVSEDNMPTQPINSATLGTATKIVNDALNDNKNVISTALANNAEVQVTVLNQVLVKLDAVQENQLKLEETSIKRLDKLERRFDAAEKRFSGSSNLSSSYSSISSVGSDRLPAPIIGSSTSISTSPDIKQTGFNPVNQSSASRSPSPVDKTTSRSPSPTAEFITREELDQALKKQAQEMLAGFAALLAQQQQKTN